MIYYDYSEVDSDGDEIPDEEDEESRKYYGYRVWYSLEIHVKPSPPERIMAVECCCQVRDCHDTCIRLRVFFSTEVYSF